MTKFELDQISAIIDELIEQRISKYKPSELLLGEFEKVNMRGYASTTPVTQVTIRELVRAVQAAFASLPDIQYLPSELKYSNGNRAMMINNDELNVYDYNGNVAIKVKRDGVYINNNLFVQSGLTLGAAAQQAVSINITQQEIDDLWTH